MHPPTATLLLVSHRENRRKAMATSEATARKMDWHGRNGRTVESIDVWYASKDTFAVLIRDHSLVVDQPMEAGGDDEGPTPTELFVAALAACVGFYAERFLRRHDLSPDQLAVKCGYEMSEDGPARVQAIELELDLPAELSASQRKALLAVVEHCTVHNSLRQPPEVRIALSGAERAA
jgi:putative redox protein